ncbi:MAG: DNA polymerase II [Pseudohongiellaceae bacterium]
MTATSIDGFLLTRQRVETDQGIELVFWITTPAGPLRWKVTGQEAVSFIPSHCLPQVKQLFAQNRGIRFGETQLKNFSHDPVTAIYCRSLRVLFDCRELIQAKRIPLYEADINIADRYLMERFITGGVSLIFTPPVSERENVIVNPAVRAIEFRPRLKCVSFDIETSYTGDTLYSIAVFHKDESKVIMIGDDQQASPSVGVIFVPDEKTLINEFLDWIEHFDPDVLIGWNVVNFDLRFLQRCCERSGIDFQLGRHRETVSWRRSRDGNDRFFVTIPGRVALDGIELMRTATYQFENFSLDHVAQQLLGRGKLVDDVDQRGAEISRLFREDKKALAEYNLEDCRLVWDIFVKEKLLDFAVERSLLTGLELNRYGGSVAAFDFLYLPRLHRAGFVAPSLGTTQVENISPGGYVMDSAPGIYDHVIVLDFKSLYPSIIRTFHVDPLALVLGLREDDAIPGFDGGRFSRHHYLLPELIANLWSARDRAKATGNKVLSQAIKIIMNSFYGVLGTTGCRFLDTRLVSSITRRGHQIIIDSKAFIEAQGYQVIYGDTDSLFVYLEGETADQVDQTGKQLTSQLNHWWTANLKREFNLDSCLEIEFETHFSRFLMPTIRGADTGSKKRYAGLVRDPGQGKDSYHLVFKGLESVRSDWSPLARKFQQLLYEKIFLDQPWEAFVKQTVADVLDGKFENELVLRRRLRRKLKDYQRNIPPHVQAAKKAELIRQERGLPSLYENGGWIEYVMTVNGPEPRQYRQSPVDYQFYLDRQLAPIADSILVFKSTSMEELLNRQIHLF